MIGSLSLSGAPTPGALLGTRGSMELINSINNASGMNAYFGSNSDPFKTGYNMFMQSVVYPIRVVGTQVQQTAKKLFETDYIKNIDTIEKLEEGIPPSMYDAIGLYEPIRELASQNRIDCFGFTNPYLKEAEDYWGRLISNGSTDVDETTLIKENGQSYIELKYEFNGSDPDYTIEELEAIQSTRNFISEFLQDEELKKYDFTNYPNLRG